MTAINHVTPTGPSLQFGSVINQLIDIANNSTGQGTPQAGTFTTGTFSSTLAVTGAATFSSTVSTGALTATTVTGTNQSWNGTVTNTPQLITAAGATQGNATAITTFNAIITVSTTASTHGVRLPTAATGLSVRVANLGTFGVKVYPATNGKIGAASTNSADSTVLAINKANVYIARNTTQWAVLRGA